MRQLTSKPQKTEGNDRASTDLKPATIVLSVGETIDVAHHCWTEDNSLLNIHSNDADGRADAQTTSHHVEAVLRTLDAQRVIQRGERR